MADSDVGGFLGPTIIGALKDRFGTHGPAFMLLGACGIIAALLAFRLRQVPTLKRATTSDGFGSRHSFKA
jgi:hypothetical protein